MFRVITTLAVLAALYTTVIGCGTEITAAQPTKLDVAEVAKAASEGVGVVGRTRRTKNATPIVVLEENHASRAGQIEHAVTLVRLHQRYGMTDIALEGYLKQHKEINVDWYREASGGDPDLAVDVALAYLLEGEISCAEFMALAFEATTLHPIEQEADYGEDISQEASNAPMLYLFNVAAQSMNQSEIRKANSMQEEIEGLPDGLQQAKIAALFDYIISTDPWASENAEMLGDVDTQLSMSTSGMVEACEQISQRGNVHASSDERRAMDEYLAYMRGRASADETMSRASSLVANRESADIVAMIVGALHTDPICDYLEDWERPFAVVTPVSFETRDKRGDLPYELYERKYSRLPVHSGDFVKILSQETGKKPEPVLNEKWFQADSEIRLFGDRVVRAVLAGSAGGAGPPLGPVDARIASFGGEDFNGRWVSIDTTQIEVVADSGEPTSGGGLTLAVLFPVRFRSGRTVWMKAAADRDEVYSKESRQDVEGLLLSALEELRQDDSARTTREDSGGRLRLSVNVIAAIGTTKDAVRGTKLLN